MIRNLMLATILGVAITGVVECQELRLNLNADSTRFIKVQLVGQFWARLNESNPFTEQQGEPVETTFDIGIRRARIQAYAQVTERASLFLHYGFNNYNTNYQYNGNRRIQAFFHDVHAEYRLSPSNELKLGIGLAFVNGLSRFSQPAVIAMPTADIPVFGQATVEQIDVFGRKLSITARGQVGQFDYRFSLSDPFPINSSGQALAPIRSAANFAQKGHSMQKQGYVIYQFFDHEPHQLSNMAGTYFGTRKIWNIAAGIMHQPRAMWRSVGADTLYEDLRLMAVESLFDMPIDQNGITVSAYAGYFMNSYGTNYLRYNGIMNPGTSFETEIDSAAPQPLQRFGPAFGNAFPMYGTGSVFYTHASVFFPRAIDDYGLMPYVSLIHANYDRLSGLPMNVYGCGISLLLEGIRSRVSVDVQNRPTFGVDPGTSNLVTGARHTQVYMQYQIVL